MIVFVSREPIAGLWRWYGAFQNFDFRVRVLCRYVFHYIVAEGITFLAMADDSVGFALPFGFLEALKSEWVAAVAAAALLLVAASCCYYL